jgi:DNA-binding NtrC family response regulator
MSNYPYKTNYFFWERKTILLIDDDYVSYTYITELLGDTKANIVCAKSKIEAQQKIKKIKNIDLILFNIYLVDNKDCILITEIKKRKPYVPVIALVDKDDIDTIADCIRTGCETYFHKPFDKFYFLATINDILEKGMILKALCHN